MQSIKSNALEPTRAELAGLSRWKAILRLAPVYGLPILLVLLIVFFSLLLPRTFPTYLNFRSILADKAIIALLSLAATVPMMAGRIDLNVGFGIVMWHILAIGLQVMYGVPWPLAILIVLACAALVGLFNGLLVEVAQIDSFIATLGTGTILYALALWFTGGRQLVGTLSPSFTWKYIARMCHMTMPKPTVMSMRPAIIGSIAASASMAMIALSARIERKLR